MNQRSVRILVTGALGQIGSELTPALRERYGVENVVASDIREDRKGILSDGPFVTLDVLSREDIEKVVSEYKIERIYHLAALLSKVAEDNPQKAWDINMGGLLNILEVARENECSVFFPSSIGVFGTTTPHDNTPQLTIQRPESMYGVTKLSGELLCDYYYNKFGVDTRGVRFPGIISSVTPPGGGTTDYAVEIFYEAVKTGRYACFLEPNTYLDMLYMPDAIKAAIEIMEADGSSLRFRNAYNITAMSFCPSEIAEEIKKHIPDFEIDYQVDEVRQGIANSWPNRMDDTPAREDWGWNPEYNLEKMTKEMIEVLKKRFKDS
mgnify:CR=1 FL=1